jgi:hypothetical protein
MLQADPNTENMVDDPLTYMGNIMLLIVGWKRHDAEFDVGRSRIPESVPG